MSKRIGRLAVDLLSRMRQLLRATECAVRVWIKKAAGKVLLIIEVVRGSRKNRSGTADNARSWLQRQPWAIRRLALDAGAGVGQWGRQAWGLMRQGALLAGRRLRELPSITGELPSIIRDFYSGNRPGKSEAIREWLADQAGVLLALLLELADQARLWGLDARDWIREDTRYRYGAARRQLRMLRSIVSDIRAGRQRVNWRGLATRPAIIAALAGFVLVGGNLWLTQSRLAYTAMYDGQEIGMVDSRQAGEEIRLQVQHELERQLGKNVFLPAALTYRTCIAPRTLLSPPGALTERFRNLPWVTDGELILVDNKPILAVADKAVAQQLLDQIKASYVQQYPGEQILDVRFQGDVALLKQQVPISEVVPAAAAMAMLKQGQAQQDRYVVKSGDSLWSIARRHNLLVSDLVQANPQMASGLLHVGDELYLSATRPLVGVLVTSKVVTREPIPRDVQVQPDANLWRGQTRVLNPGADGEAEVSYQVVRLNGQPVKRDVLASTVLKQPQPRLVAEGTQRTVAYAGGASRGSGSGVLSWPLSGIITSPFGYRGGGFHTGMDICAGYGAPVRAAAPGTVIFAGWAGGYGNCVIVDHGDGLATRYAHLSRIDVTVGKRVDKGGAIGKIGQSGNATGPHLHFEVISNGNVQNPLRFLR